MPLDFRVAKVKYDPTKGRIQNEPGTATFSSRVNKAELALRSYHMGYTDGDHHVFKAEIELSRPSITGPTVNFTAEFLLRDSSGTIDDRYDGWIDVLIIADVA